MVLLAQGQRYVRINFSKTVALHVQLQAFLTLNPMLLIIATLAC